MGYQWKGTHQGPDMFDATAPQPKQVAAPKPEPVPLRPHGTRAAYNRHRRRKETPCDKCKAHENARMAERRSRTKTLQGA